MTNTFDPAPIVTGEFHGLKINSDSKLQADHIVLDSLFVSSDPTAPAPHATAHKAYTPQAIAEGPYLTIIAGNVTVSIDGDAVVTLEVGG